MRELIAKGKYSYGLRWLKPGDEFEAEDRDADMLVRVNRAEYKPKKEQRRRYRRRDMEATEIESEQPVRRRRQYRRRDVQADE